MSYPFGITGIGYNPYMSGLGTLGLSAGGTYSSLGDTSMMGMTGMNGMGMMGMMGMPGMMGMYNPSFMGQMNQAYHEIEKQNLEQAGAMHNLMLQTKTNNYRANDEYLFQKSLEDADIEGTVTRLAEKVREGDADGICQIFDELKISLYKKNADYINANRDRLDPSRSLNSTIERLYAQIISVKEGRVTNLTDDIKAYGETAFKHGFNKKFFGKKDYHEKYSEETLNYLFGTPIDNKAGKDRMESIGGGFGRVAEAGTAAAAGYGAGLGLAAISKILNPLGICENLGLKGTHKFGKFGLIAALAGDIVWQMSRD